jgi:hypothetical protein
MGLLNIVGNLFGIGEKYIDGKNKIKEKKQELELAKVEAHIAKEKAKIENAHEVALVEQTETFNLDKAAVKAMEKDWKDDAFAIFGFFILFGAFIPPMVPHIQAGLYVLDGMPEYIKWGLGLMFIHVFGFRNLLRMFLKKKLNRVV